MTSKKVVNLWLDDNYPSPPGWEWAKTYEEAVEVATNYDIKAMSLDHDLATDKSGYDFVCWFEEAVRFGRVKLPEWIGCHSGNASGKERIEKAIQSIYNWAEKQGIEKVN